MERTAAGEAQSKPTPDSTPEGSPNASPAVAAETPSVQQAVIASDDEPPAGGMEDIPTNAPQQVDIPPAAEDEPDPVAPAPNAAGLKDFLSMSIGIVLLGVFAMYIEPYVALLDLM